MTDTTTLSYRKTEVKQVETQVPRYYAYDETKRGRLVDLLMQQAHGRRRGEDTIRDDLHSSDGEVVERAIGQLASAYSDADEIMAELGIVNDG